MFNRQTIGAGKISFPEVNGEKISYCIVGLIKKASQLNKEIGEKFHVIFWVDRMAGWVGSYS